jgi:hypothetical protein
MVRPRFGGTLHRARGAIREPEGGIQESAVLQGRALRAHGGARVELGRLEHAAVRQVCPGGPGVGGSRRRPGRVASGRRQLDAVMRSVEPRGGAPREGLGNWAPPPDACLQPSERACAPAAWPWARKR